VSEVAQVSSAAEAPRYTITSQAIFTDDWQRFTPDAAPLPPEAGNWLVPLDVWLQHAETLRARPQPVGVLIAPGDDVTRLAGQLHGLALVAVDFPTFTDGRGFSSGRLLRTRLGWQGELRAVGDVLIDIVHYLARCGFDSFTLKPGHDPEHAQRQFGVFTVHYQNGYLKPQARAA